MITNKDIKTWSDLYGCKALPPIEEAKLEKTIKQLIPFPIELKALYMSSNGLIGETFIIFPIFDEQRPKITWDSLERENNLETSKFSLSTELQEKFLILGQLGEGLPILIERHDNSIWYEDENGYNRTTLSLKEFIELSLKESLDK